MGKLRKRFNWKGRLQTVSPKAAEEDKADEVVVELKGKTSSIDLSNHMGPGLN